MSIQYAVSRWGPPGSDGIESSSEAELSVGVYKAFEDINVEAIDNFYNSDDMGRISKASKTEIFHIAYIKFLREVVKYANQHGINRQMPPGTAATFKWVLEHYPEFFKIEHLEPFLTHPEVFAIFIEKESLSRANINQVEFRNEQPRLVFFDVLFSDNQLIVSIYNALARPDNFKVNILSAIRRLTTVQAWTVFLEYAYANFLESPGFTLGVELREVVVGRLVEVIDGLPDQEKSPQLFFNLLVEEIFFLRKAGDEAPKLALPMIVTNLNRICHITHTQYKDLTITVNNETTTEQKVSQQTGVPTPSKTFTLIRILHLLFSRKYAEQFRILVANLDTELGQNLPFAFLKAVVEDWERVGFEKIISYDQETTSSFSFFFCTIFSIGPWRPTAQDADDVTNYLHRVLLPLNLPHTHWLTRLADSIEISIFINPRAKFSESSMQNALLKCLRIKKPTEFESDAIEDLLKIINLETISQALKNKLNENKQLYPTWTDFVQKQAEKYKELHDSMLNDPVFKAPEAAAAPSREPKKKNNRRRNDTRPTESTDSGSPSDGSGDAEPRQANPPVQEPVQEDPEELARAAASEAQDQAIHATNQTALHAARSASAAEAQEEVREAARAAEDAQRAAAAAAEQARQEAAAIRRLERERVLREQECEWKEVRSDLMYIHQNKTAIRSNPLYTTNILPNDTIPDWLTALDNSRVPDLVRAAQSYRQYLQALEIRLPSTTSKFELLLFLRNYDQHNNLNFQDYVNCRFLKDAESVLHFRRYMTDILQFARAIL